MAFLMPVAPLAIEGLTAVIALASAGAVVSALAQVPRTTYWSGPTFSGGFGGRGGGSRRPPSPPELPPDPRDAIIAALLADMMARYSEKRGALQMEGPQVDGPLVYDSLITVDMRLKDKHEWCGHFQRGPPQNVREAVEGEEPKEDLVHQGAPPQGSKAGLAYAAGATQWIVAWHAPLNSDPKIYVECGRNLPIDWSRIEKALDASGKDHSSCKGARAAIKRDNKNNAVICVVFYT